MSTSRSRAGADLLDERLRAIASIAPEAGIFCDFDGSLSEIVDDPAEARAVRGVGPLLKGLARSFRVVAVVSGRPVAFLAQRLRAPGVRMIGLYGIEQQIGRRRVVVPEAVKARPFVEQALERLHVELRDVPGVFIENKRYGVSVHFRRTPDPDVMLERARPLVGAVAADLGLAAVSRGKLVLEIGPRVDVNKGTVVRALIEQEQLRGAIVAGDDRGDIAMFDAAEAADQVVRIAVTTDETPRELIERAHLSVGSPRALVALLRAVSSA